MIRTASALAAAAAISAGAVTTASANDALDVYGAWLTEKQNSVVVISKCDEAPCGEIVWIDAPDAQTLTDTENPDEAQRARPLIGLKMLYGFEAKKDQWKKGRIYDPETGKTYGSRLRRLEDGTLQVKGCIGPICQTQIWTPSEIEIAATANAATDAASLAE